MPTQNILQNFSPYENRVQEGMTDGRFMNAAYTVIAAGPPRLSNLGGSAVAGAALSTGLGQAIAYPIGIVQNFSLGHNMTISRFFEIGSHRSYFIPGRAMGQFSMSRVMYHGPSLLKVMYAYYTDAGMGNDPEIPPLTLNLAQGSTDPLLNRHDVKYPAGYENLYLNLASDLFTQPIGLMLIMKDSNEKTMGAFYLECCYIPNHNIATDAMGTIIQEQVAVQFERAVPIKTNVIGLITNDLDINQGLTAESAPTG